jgi:hypothetical protein
MNTSSEINELADALSKAQGQMGGASKTADNPFLKSKYADLASVIAAIKEPLASNGLSYIQNPFTRNGSVGVATRLMHKSGQWIESSFSIPAPKHDAQTYGALVTYCRRFTLQSVLGVPAEDDDGNSITRQAEAIISTEQCHSVRAMIELAKADETRFLKSYGVESIEKLTVSQFKHAVELLEKKRKVKK